MVGNHSSALSFLLAVSSLAAAESQLKASWAENGVGGISFPGGAQLWKRFSNVHIGQLLGILGKLGNYWVYWVYLFARTFCDASVETSQILSITAYMLGYSLQRK